MSWFFPNESGQLTSAEVAWVEAAAVVGLPSVSSAGQVFGVNGIGTAFQLAAAAASGFSPLFSTETPDGNNNVFTFPSKPTYIISGGAWYLENDGWTWNSVTSKATLGPVPPSSVNKLLAFK